MPTKCKAAMKLTPARLRALRQIEFSEWGEVLSVTNRQAKWLWEEGLIANRSDGDINPILFGITPAGRALLAEIDGPSDAQLIAYAEANRRPPQ